jgi:hypothetical protein
LRNDIQNVGAHLNGQSVCVVVVVVP